MENEVKTKVCKKCGQELPCSNLMLVGKVSKIASICGTGSTKYYHLEIDGELRTFLPQNLQLVEKRNNNPKK